MILAIAAAAIVSTVAVEPVCVWNDRGLHRVTVPVSPLVDHYPDIPKATRDKLKQRIDRFQYDEMVVISRDGIKSDVFTYSGMQYMHFGNGQKVCGEVKTDHWAPGDIERAMIFCQDGHCLALPLVCSNLARVTRFEPVRREASVQIPPIESPGGLDTEFKSPSLTLGFVDPEPVFPSLLNVPEIQIQPEIEEEWPFSRSVQWRLLGPIERNVEPSAVPVAVVPEPGTWLLMLFGLGVVGFWARRKA
jgi:hypothetical protein